MTIDLLRHGETTLPGHFCGSTDVMLSAHGWAQMRAAAQRHGPWDMIVSSPLRRCAEFAREIAAADKLAITLDERWRELHFGTWEGQHPRDVAATDSDALTQFWSNPQSDPPPHGGETWPCFQARVVNAWRDLAHLADGRRVLVITHGGVIRLLLGQAHGVPAPRLMSIDVPYASLHRIAMAATA